MELIMEIESKHPTPATSSYYPESYQEPYDSLRIEQEHPGEGETEASPTIDGHEAKANTCRYLPCHYFDFIAGTSTGG
jgi:hypothetical protein